MDAPTITLAGYPALLQPPRPSLALGLAGEGFDLSDPGQRIRWYILGAAALAECYPDAVAWPAPIRPRKWRLGQRLDSYAQEVFDDLARVVHVDKVAPACQTAMMWARSHAISETEVAEAEDFSEPPQGG